MFIINISSFAGSLFGKLSHGSNLYTQRASKAKLKNNVSTSSGFCTNYDNT